MKKKAYISPLMNLKRKDLKQFTYSLLWHSKALHNDQSFTINRSPCDLLIYLFLVAIKTREGLYTIIWKGNE